jgi:hypothetical protein
LPSRPFHRNILHSARKVATLLVLIAYLCVGALHGLHDLEGTAPSGATGLSLVQVSLVQDGSSHAPAGIVADHHCHGCFSVSVPAPTAFAAISEMPAEVPSHHDANRRSFSDGIDLPPPKSLT